MKDTEITQCVEILEAYVRHCETPKDNLYFMGPDGKEHKIDIIKDDVYYAAKFAVEYLKKMKGENVKKFYVNDHIVESEISRLMVSPYVRLAQAEERIRQRRQEILEELRALEQRGKELEAEGFRLDMLEDFSFWSE